MHDIILEANLDKYDYFQKIILKTDNTCNYRYGYNQCVYYDTHGTWSFENGDVLNIEYTKEYNIMKDEFHNIAVKKQIQYSREMKDTHFFNGYNTLISNETWTFAQPLSPSNNTIPQSSEPTDVVFYIKKSMNVQ